MPHPTFHVIGGAVVDISLCFVDESVFRRPSTPIERITMTSGGDAMNEASVLSALGEHPRLVTVLGEDSAGSFLLSRCRDLGIDTAAVQQCSDFATSVNGVLVEGSGERRFVTAKDTSLRRLSPKHILPALSQVNSGDIVSFASIFVSHACGIPEMEQVFRAVRERGALLCADMTTAKKGETVDDLAPLLPYIDYLIPNALEGSLVTGCTSPEDIAQKLRSRGVKNVILKLGSEGCYYDGEEGQLRCGAYPHARMFDSTGAGDTFSAAFQWSLAKSWSMMDRLRFANAAASICIEHPACCPEALDLEEILRRAGEIR